MHGCEAEYMETAPVHEVFRGQTVWLGDVEVFDLIGHPKAKRCFAWAHETDSGSKRFVAVLELPPVDSPENAVRASIIEETRNAKKGS